LFLRSLTIKGFKSFARKTVLEFEPGMTVIVGPNGVGKSNIADAVMWVLGEQSPTSLRGNRMEDVIFAGSMSLKPVNMAEVSLTLDNSNNDFPLDYSEVVISRNVVRGGDSEYRLNNSPCRLLDIQELLSDAGVGRSVNAVISQGQLDEVLSCLPAERRNYIEEAGGLLKYRKRREKAMRRLARMDEEFLRINDVAREVRRALRPLQRQAGRLEQYTTVVGEMNETKLRLDVARLRAMRVEHQGRQDKREECSRRLGEIEKTLREKAAEASMLEKAQSEWQTREGSLRGGLYRLVSLHEQLKVMLSLADEKFRRLKEEDAVPPAALEQLTAENLALDRSRAAILEKLEELRKRETELESSVLKINSHLNDLARRRATIEARLEVLRESEREQADLAEKAFAEKKAELARLTGERATAESEFAILRERESLAHSRLDELSSSLESLDAGSAGVMDQLREAERQQAGLVATLSILTRFETETCGPASVSAALIDSDPTGGRLEGMLAPDLKIDPSHESAIVGYLGPWLFGIVACDTNAIVVAIEHLKKKGLGQGLFFRRGGEEPSHERSSPHVEGAARARDAVEAPDRFGDALDALLDGVYLADDLKSAVKLAGRYPQQTFLSPAGDVIAPGGMIKGGSPTVNPAVIDMTAGRRRQLEDSLEDLSENINALELRRKYFTDETSRAKAELLDAGSAFSTARDALKEKGLRNTSLTARIEALKADVEGCHKTPAAAKGRSQVDQAQLESQAGTLIDEERLATAELQKCESAHSALTREARAAVSEIATLDRRLETGRVKERSLRSRKQGCVLHAIDEDDLANIVALRDRLVMLLEAARERAKRGLDEGVLKEKEAMNSARALRGAIDGLQAERESLRDRMHAEELSNAEMKVRVEQLVDRIVDDHKVPLEFALKHYPDEAPMGELEARIEELTRQLEAIGPINPKAIIERETLEQRSDLFKTQIDDIEQARAQLKRVVHQVDREIEQKFSDTLDAINHHFKEIFITLFPNGDAELRLTDPDDLLGTGVEIMAQPEGKRLRRLSLLSGGETSMAALAFFFALFKVRPSPFYFLDEVEAALDDVNLHKFLNLAREFKGESQLVLITHQKRSMEIADILYGVSMQDDGMSRVISQKVEQKAAS